MPPPEGLKPFTVTSLTVALKARLEEFYPTVWVAGEISNFVRAASGHVYFTLKDANAVLRCMLPRGFAYRARMPLHDGMQVLVRGGVSIYPAKGEYQLYVEEVVPKGVGAAELALRQLKEKLHAKGYFDPARKRQLLKFPRRVALIASPTGAAIRDMLEILKIRWPHAEAIIRPSLVQGVTAAEEIAANIRFLSRLHASRVLILHAIVLGRGGGSHEDLSAFNEEIVADAIFQSSVPVVSAVGHEIDVTIADLVADHRALTPSQAITLMTPDRGELLAHLAETQERLRDSLAAKVRLARSRLDQLQQRPALRRPLDRFRDHERRLDEIAMRLDRALQRMIARWKESIASSAERLEALSPLGVLARGYSLTFSVDRRLIRRAEEVVVGERIITQTRSGTVESIVDRIDPS